MIKLALARVMELGINQILSLHPKRQMLCDRHDGKVLLFDITDIHQQFFLIQGQEKIFVYTSYNEEPTTTIRGNFFSFMRQFSANQHVEGISITGESEFAQSIQSLLKGVDIPWEEYLSFFVGDVTTHHLSNLWNRIRTKTTSTHQRTVEDMLAFVQEEQRLLPTREEVEDFYEDIAMLRKQIDRVEAHLNRLMEKVSTRAKI